MIIKNETFRDKPITDWFRTELITFHEKKYGEKCTVVYNNKNNNKEEN